MACILSGQTLPPRQVANTHSVAFAGLALIVWFGTDKPRLSAFLLLLISGTLAFAVSFFSDRLPGADGRFGKCTSYPQCQYLGSKLPRGGLGSERDTPEHLFLRHSQLESRMSAEADVCTTCFAKDTSDFVWSSFAGTQSSSVLQRSNIRCRFRGYP